MMRKSSLLGPVTEFSYRFYVKRDVLRNSCDNIMQLNHHIIKDIQLIEELNPFNSFSSPRHKVMIRDSCRGYVLRNRYGMHC